MLKNIFKNIFNIFKRKGKKDMLIEKLKKLLADGLITKEEFEQLSKVATDDSSNSDADPVPPVDDVDDNYNTDTDDNGGEDNPPVDEDPNQVVDDGADDGSDDVVDDNPPVDEPPVVEDVPPVDENPTTGGTGGNADLEKRLATLENNVALILQKIEGLNKKPQEVAEPVGGQRKLFGYSKN